MSDQTPLDVEAIRARLDATSPGMTVDVHDGGSTLRATGNTTDRAGFVGSIGDLVETFTGGNLGPVTATFVDDEDGQDATFALHAAADIRDLLDENTRLNAENNTLTVQLNNSKMCALRELQAQIRGDEAEAERDALVVKVAVLTEFADSVRRAQPRSNHSELDQGWNACLESIQDGLTPSVLAALPAAPEMPRPPAEEAHSGPETPGTGSGRGTGVTEASGTAQAREEWGVRRRDGRVLSFEDRDDAEAFADGWRGGERTVVHRFIGAWKPVPSLPVPSTEESQ